MKIRAITIEAFRGFRERVRFNFQDAQVVLLYGPNGHGKTSVFDAIEWALTGEIHRYSLSTDERNRTRFVRNLHAKSDQTTYVALEMLLHPNTIVKVTRICTAGPYERTDYGKNELQITVLNAEQGEKIILGEEANRLLRNWLVEEAWRDKVTEPARGVSLTHMLGQEKLNQLLRGMKDGERYNTLSLLFGTEHFLKYREMFRRISDKLDAQIQRKNLKIKQIEISIDLLKQIITNLEDKVAANGQQPVKKLLSQYVEYFENARELYDRENWQELRKLVQQNQEGLLNKRYQLVHAIQSLKAAQDALPMWRDEQAKLKVGMQKIVILNERLRDVRRLDEVKVLIKQLPHYEEGAVKQAELQAKIAQAINAAVRLELRADHEQEFVNNVRKILLRVIEQNELVTYVEVSALELDDLETRLKVIQAFDRAKEVHLFSNALQEGLNTSTQHVKDLEKMIGDLRVFDQKYQSLLSVVSEYVAVKTDLEECPACGRAGITADHLRHHVETEQGKMHPELPELEKRLADTRKNVGQQAEKLSKYRQQYQQEIDQIGQLLLMLEERVKAKRAEALRERYQEQALLNENKAWESFLKDYRESAQRLQMEPTAHDFDDQLMRLEQELETLLALLSPEDRVGLSDEILVLNVEQEKSRAVIDDFIGKLQLLSDSNDMNREWTEEELLSLLQEMSSQQRVRLELLEKQEQLTTRSLVALEHAQDELQLASQRKEMKMQEQLVDQLIQARNRMSTDQQISQEVMSKVENAKDGLNQKMIRELFDTVQKVFARINSHPLYRKLDFSNGFRYNAYRLLIHALTGEEGESPANPSYIFSSAQVNSIALSFFMAMALHQRWSPLQIMAMDDPIQSMDEVNVLSLIDMVRVFIEKYEKQVFISTHDHAFYQMMVRKFRFQHLAVIEYEGYCEAGPVIRAHMDEQNQLMVRDGEVQYVQVIPPLMSEALQQDLFKLDHNL